MRGVLFFWRVMLSKKKLLTHIPQGLEANLTPKFGQNMSLTAR